MKFKITILLLLVTILSNAQKLEDEVLDKLSNSICAHLEEEGDIDNLTSIEALKVFTESMFKAYATDPEYYKENGLDFTAGDEVLEAYGEQLVCTWWLIAHHLYPYFYLWLVMKILKKWVILQIAHLCLLH